MHWLDPLQPSLLISLPVGFAAKSAVVGWLAWTMWHKTPESPLGFGLRWFYGWITLTSIGLTLVLGALAWQARDDDLGLFWLVMLVVLDVTSIASAYWGWRVRNAYIRMARQMRDQDTPEQGA